VPHAREIKGRPRARKKLRGGSGLRLPCASARRVPPLERRNRTLSRSGRIRFQAQLSRSGGEASRSRRTGARSARRSWDRRIAIATLGSGWQPVGRVVRSSAAARYGRDSMNACYKLLAAIVAIFSRASLRMCGRNVLSPPCRVPMVGVPLVRSLRRGMALFFVALVVLLGEIALVVAAVILSSHK
jgi:hypothetical protein